MLSIYLPDKESRNAEIIVTVAYIEPKAVFDILKDSIQKGTNSDIKNVWPKEEKN